MNHKSDEFYRLVGKRLSEVIDRTQVVDSPFHRAPIVNDPRYVTLTAFQTEVFKSFSVVQSCTYDVVLDPKDKKAWKRLGKGVAAHVTAQFLAGWLAAAWSAFIRDKDEEKGDAPVYEFEPKLFGLVDLSVTAGFTSVSSVIILIFALASAATQFIMSRQQDPTRGGKNGKKRSVRQILKDAAKGKEASQEDINAAAQGQMTFMMPMMMLLIMISLPGALVFYYLLNNIITVILQKIILNRNYTEMEAAADKTILKELKDAKEAVIVEDNTKTTKKTGSRYASDKKQKDEKVHITRISASNKKKRR
jgi:hypothetical protein